MMKLVYSVIYYRDTGLEFHIAAVRLEGACVLIRSIVSLTDSSVFGGGRPNTALVVPKLS